MEDKLFELLDDLNIRDTNLLLDKDISLSIDNFTRKRIEKSIKERAGHYSKSRMIMQSINNILDGIFVKRKIAVALLIGIALSLGGGTYAYAKAPVAYVSVDINPSIELGVNAFDKVISAEAYNEDGQKILEGTDLINNNINNAVSTIISNAISNGYIHDDGSSAIEITTATNKEKVAAELKKSLKDITDETLKNNDVQAEVETESIALARRNEARKLGITPGKLNLIQKLQELDPTINIEDYKASSVRDIQKKTEELIEGNTSNKVSTDESTNLNTSVDVVNDEKTDKSSNNNGNTKKEENSNSNSKKEESNSTSDKEKDDTTTSEKQNNNKLNSQSNNNSNSQNNNGDREKTRINNK